MCYQWTSKGDKFVEWDDDEPDLRQFREHCPKCGRFVSIKGAKTERFPAVIDSVKVAYPASEYDDPFEMEYTNHRPAYEQFKVNCSSCGDVVLHEYEIDDVPQKQEEVPAPSPFDVNDPFAE